MAKAVLISIRPEWVEKILSGEKTLEVRKNRPKLETPFKVYIYCTAGNLSYKVNGGMVCNVSVGKLVVGEFVCDKIDCIDIPYPAFMGTLDKHWMDNSCCTYWQLHRYLYHDNAYFWHISNLKIYGKPLDLTAFQKPVLPTGLRYEDNGIKRPPQSWCYVEELKNE